MVEEGYGSIGVKSERFKNGSQESEPPQFQAELKNRRARKSRLMSFIGTGDTHKRNIDLEHDSFEDLETYATIDDVDAAIDLIAEDEAHSSCIREVHPHRVWLWKQWKGTVMISEGSNCAIIMAIATAITLLVPMVEDETNLKLHIESGLAATLSLWTYMLTLTTFVLTFYTQQAFDFWFTIYTTFRDVQFRLSELSMLFATHAARNDSGEYTPESLKMLKDVAIHNRLFSIFTYATLSRRYRILHTSLSLKRMVERGVMPCETYIALKKLKSPYDSRCYTMLELIMIKLQSSLKNKTSVGGDGYEQVVLDRCCNLLGAFLTFGDYMDARIPLAYAHLMQVMIDVLLLLAPFALYSEMDWLCIPASGVISFFFSGLLHLSKVFMDPMDNEDYYDDMMEMNVGVFIRESNGLSKVFYNGVETLPDGWTK